MGRTTHECRSQELPALDKFVDMLPPPAVQPVLERSPTPGRTMGFVTVEENGSWFVSPLRTVLQAVSAWLALFQPSDIQTFISNAVGHKGRPREVLRAIGRQREQPHPLARPARGQSELTGDGRAGPAAAGTSAVGPP